MKRISLIDRLNQVVSVENKQMFKNWISSHQVNQLNLKVEDYRRTQALRKLTQHLHALSLEKRVHQDDRLPTVGNRLNLKQQLHHESQHPAHEDVGELRVVQLVIQRRLNQHQQIWISVSCNSTQLVIFHGL